MDKNVYITKLSSFLPNEPVENDEMEDSLGYIGGHSSRIKRIILGQNQIKQRYYAIKGGNYTHTNAELMANAIAGLFDDGFAAKDIQLLSCGTSTPDQMMPSHTSMVHGLLKDSNPIPILSPSGVCCSAAHALEYCFLSVLSGHTNNAICGGSELFSPLLRSNIFEEEYKAISQIQSNPYIAFEKDFLRWMLSDGAGCALLSDMPSDGISLKIKWIESVSYANELDVCMSQGLQNTASGEWTSWKAMRPVDWQTQSIFAIKQNIKLLAEYGVEKSVLHIANSCKKHQLNFADVDYFLPHISSMFFYDKLADKLKEKGLLLDEQKWFTNLSYVGNVGAASIFIMLDELFNSSKLKNGELIYLFIPESQAIALMNKFLDAPSFFYFEDVIGFDPTTSISTGSFTVNRNGKTIHVRSIQVGVIGKNGKYGVYGTPVTSKEFYSLRNGMVLHGEPIYEENDVERANPVGMRYYYTTNDVNHSQNCWIAINWADASTFESIIGW